MKIYMSVLLLLSCMTLSAQFRRFEFSGGIGNNGQIQKVLNDYNYPSNPLYVLDESQSAKASQLKYNLAGKLYLNHHLSLRVKYGISKTHNEYYYSSYLLNGDIWDKQTVTNISPAIGFSKSAGKLSITAGIEFSFYDVNNFVSFFKGHEIIIIQQAGGQTSTMVPRKFESEIIIEGGRGTAINCYLDLECLISRRFGAGGSISYGYLWTKFGDEIIQRDTYKYYPFNTYNQPENAYYKDEKTFKGKAFSAPEISVFLFIRIGKLVDKKNVKEPVNQNVSYVDPLTYRTE